ncbi:oxidoreductase [candidate division KSB1 bacterium]|nr:MAG: oxidoreductase [candidate division KSB1 bacterium]MCE7940218.1 oxidoreductase [Chlorobi bacterium CHB1]MDL1875836.1 oxidoreductase [Cytophagia bacterium CHB2]
MAKTALVLGASGLVGSHCLQLLLDNAAYDKIIVWLRKPLPVQHAKLEQDMIDFDQLSPYADKLKNVQEIFCCLGTTIKKAGSPEAFYKVDFTYPHEIAKLAAQNGVQQFLIVTALGANSRSSIFYNRVKGEIETALGKLPLPGLQIFRPSLLLGERQEFRLGERIGAIVFTALSFAFFGRLRRYRAIAASVVAEAMIRIAQQNLTGVNIFESEKIQALTADR